jgi:DNA-binding response OmpR family regulator
MQFRTQVDTAPREFMKLRILIIEDNPKIAGSMKKGLEQHGFSVDLCLTGFEGEDLAVSGAYDVILLDLMLPDRDGIEVCRNLRRRNVTSGIIMLTALSATLEKVNGLDAGADDYMTKPFEFDELLARIRSVLRRGEATESRVLRCDDLELDVYTRQAKRAGKPIELSNKEFALLEYLLRNPDRVLSRAQIGEKVWDMNFEPSSNVIDVYVASLRKKIDRGFARELIHTLKGAGYRFGALDPSE